MVGVEKGRPGFRGEQRLALMLGRRGITKQIENSRRSVYYARNACVARIRVR